MRTWVRKFCINFYLVLCKQNHFNLSEIYNNFSCKTISNSCISKKKLRNEFCIIMMLGKILVTLSQSASVCWATVCAWCVVIGQTLGQQQWNDSWMNFDLWPKASTITQRWAKNWLLPGRRFARRIFVYFRSCLGKRYLEILFCKLHCDIEL